MLSSSTHRFSVIVKISVITFSKNATFHNLTTWLTKNRSRSDVFYNIWIWFNAKKYTRPTKQSHVKLNNKKHELLWSIFLYISCRKEKAYFAKNFFIHDVYCIQLLWLEFDVGSRVWLICLICIYNNNNYKTI